MARAVLFGLSSFQPLGFVIGCPRSRCFFELTNDSHCDSLARCCAKIKNYAAESLEIVLILTA
jgi:hypothetical protein